MKRKIEWGRFETKRPKPFSLAEDQKRINSEEEYLVYRMEVFGKVAERFLIPEPTLDPAYLSNVRKDPVESIDNSTRARQALKYSFLKWNENGGTRFGMVLVEETLNPRGYRISKYWNGKRIRNEWLSWKDARTGMY